MSIPTPQSSIPNGYKMVIHRYYTEIVPVDSNIPQTPVKTKRSICPNNDNNYEKYDEKYDIHKDIDEKYEK